MLARLATCEHGDSLLRAPGYAARPPQKGRNPRTPRPPATSQVKPAVKALQGSETEADLSTFSSFQMVTFPNAKRLLWRKSDYFGPLTAVKTPLLCPSRKLKGTGSGDASLRREGHRNELKAERTGGEMERSKCLLQGPRTALQGLRTCPRLAARLLQARRRRGPRTGQRACRSRGAGANVHTREGGRERGGSQTRHQGSPAQRGTTLYRQGFEPPPRALRAPHSGA